ncbi:anoctamin-7-like isoform X3 [Cherax quadricarinatus]|uniref:anoctamin-7-like isoform X3 n=1 Tax=Cherax quadricarinatus TaxID=27406 RepID=UPI00387ED45F
MASLNEKQDASKRCLKQGKAGDICGPGSSGHPGGRGDHPGHLDNLGHGTTPPDHQKTAVSKAAGDATSESSGQRERLSVSHTVETAVQPDRKESFSESSRKAGPSEGGQAVNSSSEEEDERIDFSGLQEKAGRTRRKRSFLEHEERVTFLGYRKKEENVEPTSTTAASSRADTPQGEWAGWADARQWAGSAEGEDWEGRSEGPGWAELSGAVLKELWNDARDYLEAARHPQQHGGDADSWRSSGGLGPGRPQPHQEDTAIFFRDGRRRIDYVLVYEDSGGASRRGCEERDKTLNRTQSTSEKRALKHESWRERFMNSLVKAGLHMEEETEETGKKVICFIKVSAPWPVLCHYAEELNMRAPLQVRQAGMLHKLLRAHHPSSTAHNNPSTNWSEVILERIHLPNLMAEDVPNKPLDYFTCAFKKSKINRFLGSDNPDQYFTNTQRSRIVHEILSTAPFGKRKKGEIGFERLVEEGVYSAAFPLHDGAYEYPVGCRDPTQLNPRQVLYHYWARWGKWYKYQPLDHIREYFGEKIGIYFAWLGLYTGWLLPAALVGLLVFLYGVLTINQNTPANEICNQRGVFKMCPLCNETLGCAFWDLNDICVNARISYLFDHPGTVFYAIFVSFWAVSFLEYWKRKSASLAHHWDCLDFQEEEERPRPEFAAKAPCQERNPITGVREPSFPKSIRTKRIMAGVGLIFIMMSLVIIFIVAVIIYRVLVSIPLFRNDTLRAQAQAISSLSGAVVNFIIIMCMGRVYEKLAHRLTTWEMHRTQSEFEDNLTFKVFIFQFVNFYSSIFYIAFFKGRFVGYPGHYHHILGLRNEDCSAGGCLIELAQQLAVIMIGKQVVNNAQEILVPKAKAWWHKKQVKMTHKARTRWEADYQLIDNEGLFQEYLEMVLQFGFITIFVAAFPLAPLFALLNNWVEIRLDAQKFVCETRRAVSERAQNIGIWFTILDFMAHLAVISNAFLIAFTSEFLPRLLYKYEYDWSLRGYVNFTLAKAPNNTLSEECRYRGYRDSEGRHTLFFWRLLAIRLGFVIVFEHVVFGVCRLIDILVPDVPQSLEIKMKRERYLAKQALADSDTIMKVAQGKDEEDEDVVAANDINIVMNDADTPSVVIPPPVSFPSNEPTPPPKESPTFSNYDFENTRDSPVANPYTKMSPTSRPSSDANSSATNTPSSSSSHSKNQYSSFSNRSPPVPSNNSSGGTAMPTTEAPSSKSLQGSVNNKTPARPPT